MIKMGVFINSDCFIKKMGELGLIERSTSIDGIRFLLKKMARDKRLTDFRHAAYMFATIKHETAHTFKPIQEYDNKAGTYLKSKKYYPYFGRGYVQLTWKSNYKKYGDLLGVDLVNNKELAKDPEIAYEIMSIGMLSKPTFTGVNLHRYINDEKTDYWNARRVINGTSGATWVEGLAKKFHTAIQGCLSDGPLIAGFPMPSPVVAGSILTALFMGGTIWYNYYKK